MQITLLGCKLIPSTRKTILLSSLPCTAKYIFKSLNGRLKPPLEAVVQTCYVKEVLLESSHKSKKNTCPRVSFIIKLQPAGLQLYLKRDSVIGVFL